MTNTARDVELLLIDAGWIQAADKRTGEPAPFLQGNSRLFVINAIHGKTEYAIGGGEGQAHATPLDAAHYLISMIQPAEPEPEPEAPVVEEYVAPQIIEAVVPDPRDEELAAAEAELAALRARVAELERPEPEAPLLPAPDALMSDWGNVGADEDAEAALTTDDLLSVDDEAAADVVAKLSRQRRKRFTELLNVELAELQQSRDGPHEDRKREAKVERLLGVFARVGEM
jgi:hypothetical protein